MEEHCYIVSYDLVKPSGNYVDLYKAIKQYNHWGHLTESTWAVVSERTTKEIRDDLLRFLDNDDRLIVILCGKSAAWKNILASSDWVKRNLSK